MKGIDVKEKLIQNKIKFKEVSEAMGITQQAFFSLMRTNDVKTNVLERIANAINKDIGWFLDESEIKNNNCVNPEISKLNTIIESDGTGYLF